MLFRHCLDELAHLLSFSNLHKQPLVEQEQNLKHTSSGHWLSFSVCPLAQEAVTCLQVAKTRGFTRALDSAT